MLSLALNNAHTVVDGGAGFGFGHPEGFSPGRFLGFGNGRMVLLVAMAMVMSADFGGKD